ncbi:LysM peptidoglycan-binding domain-containing protein [Zooshikella ganghwensis]|uniref:LysM peptidoglycan-binding domain-containing protein n=1 Tax=Zooshikella ganghwensis TaxID=202772 RepID=UPI00041A2C7A|nr:LysM peptidoglycan-binding domain-containing protein [Zooshikella ganghwensis]
MSSNKIYRIQPGDTLATIALKNGVSVEDLRQANPGITDDNLIYANTNIRIPEPSCDDPYVIKRGDTLGDLAKKHDTTVDEILKENKDIKDPDKIYAGYELKIPGRKPQDECPVPPKGGPEKQEPVKIEEPKDKKKIEEPKKQEPEKIEEPKDKKKIEEPKKQEPEKIKEPKDKEKTKEPEEQEPKAEEKLPEDKDKPCEECDSKCNVKIACAHKKRSLKNKKPKVISVVPDVKPSKTKLGDGVNEYSDTIGIELSGSQAPDKLNHNLDAKAVKKVSDTKDRKTFEVEASYIRPALNSEFRKIVDILELITVYQKPVKKYKVNGPCLGDLGIHVYSASVWEFTLLFPSFKSRKIGIKKIFRDKELLKTDEIKGYDPRKAEVESYTLEEKRKEVTSESDDGIPQTLIEQSRTLSRGTENAYPEATLTVDNGFGPEPIKFSCLEELNPIFHTVEVVHGLITALRTLSTAKLGFYADVNIDVFKGGLQIKLQNKEYKDKPDVYTYYEILFCIKMLEIKFEVGLAIQIKDDYYIKAFISLEASWVLKAGVVFEEKEKTQVISENKAVPKIGIEVKFGEAFGASVTGETGVEYKTTMDIDINANEKIKVEGEGKVLPVVIKANIVSVHFKVDWNEEKELMQEYPFGKFKWPEGKEEKNKDAYNPAKDLDDVQIRAILKKKFSEFVDVRISEIAGYEEKEISPYLLGGINPKKYKVAKIKTYDVDYTVKQVVENMRKKQAILKLDKKSIEALALKIDEDLREMRGFGGVYVRKEHFNEYIKGEFQNVLDDYISQGNRI